MVLAVNSQKCTSLDVYHSVQRKAESSLNLVLERYVKVVTHWQRVLVHCNLPVLSPFVVPSSAKPQPATVTKNVSAARNGTAPTSGKPPVHQVFASANGGLSVASYNGGFRGSTQDKRKFFEMVAEKQITLDPPPRRHYVPKVKNKTDRLLEMATMDRSIASDAGTEISGYDSVAADFAPGRDCHALSTSGNQTPVRCVK